MLNRYNNEFICNTSHAASDKSIQFENQISHWWALRPLEDVVARLHPTPCSHLYKQSLLPQSYFLDDLDEVWHPSEAKQSVHHGAAAPRPTSSPLRSLLRSKGQRATSRPQTPQCRHKHNPASGYQHQSLPKLQHLHKHCSFRHLTAGSVVKMKGCIISVDMHLTE